MPGHSAWRRPPGRQCLRIIVTGNELTQLAGNFNTLSEKLAEYEREMTTLRVSARQEIGDRTRDIEARLRDFEIQMRAKTSSWRT